MGSLGVHQPRCQLSHRHTGSSQNPQRRVRNCKISRKFLCQELPSQIFRALIGVVRISFGLKNGIFCRKIHSRKIIVFDYNICLIKINHSQICRYIIRYRILSINNFISTKMTFIGLMVFMIALQQTMYLSLVQKTKESGRVRQIYRAKLSR